ALVLLTATSAALAVIVRLSKIDVGFDNERAAIFEVTLPVSKYTGVPAMTRVAHAVDEAVRAVPGVTATGVTNFAPASHDLAVAAVFRREEDDLHGPVSQKQIALQQS